VAGIGVLTMPPLARERHRPWTALALSFAGMALIAVPLSMATRLPRLPTLVLWLAVGLALSFVAVLALSAWRLHAQVRDGLVEPEIRAAPEMEIADEMRKARRRAALVLVTLLSLVGLFQPLLRWVVGRGALPAGVLEVGRSVLQVVLWIALGVVAEALTRFAGHARSRRAVLAQARERRFRRLQVHGEIMSALERSS
jgi:hypothetical protein